jgi:hypothetical protein
MSTIAFHIITTNLNTCVFVGVGKSETAFRIADTILPKKARVGISRRFIPVGLTIFRGEEYSDSSDAFMNGGVAEVSRLNKSFLR